MAANSVSFDFSGKTALVTGGSRGIGRGICIALAEAGAKTFGLAKTKKNLDDLVAQYPSIHPVCADLSNWEETRKTVESVGPIDLLVNNAGIFKTVPFLDETKESIDEMFEIDFKAAFNVSQVVARSMIDRKCPGSIVNISSQISLRVIPGSCLYGAAKSALDSLTRSMALELGPHQIRVNSVNPTMVMTEMTVKGGADPTAIRTRVPLGRVGEVSDVVGPVMYLLSDRADFVSGTFLTVDGGYTVW